jgi:hypothetical protein
MAARIVSNLTRCQRSECTHLVQSDVAGGDSRMWYAQYCKYQIRLIRGREKNEQRRLTRQVVPDTVSDDNLAFDQVRDVLLQDSKWYCFL